MTPGERLKAAREKAGLTQAQLATALGFKVAYKAYISDVEVGRRTPTANWLLKTAHAIGCRLSDLDPRFEQAAVGPKKSRK